MLCGLVLTLACASSACAATTPAWELASSQTPADVLLAEPVSQVDRVLVYGVPGPPNAGDFALEVESEAGERGKTAPLSDTTSPAKLQAALEAVSFVGRGDVKVTGGPQEEGGSGQLVWSYAVTFMGSLAGHQLMLDAEELEASEAEEEALESKGDEPEEGYVEVSVTTRGQRETVKYELVASNTGGSPTSGTITVTDTLPSGLSTKATPSGAGWQCAPPGEGQTAVTCTTEAVVNPGAKTAPITIEAYVDVTSINAGSHLVNRATIWGGGASTPAAIESTTGLRAPTPASGSAINRRRTHRVSSRQIAAQLLRRLTQSARATTIAALLKNRGFAFVFTAVEAGTAVIDWYQPPAQARPAAKVTPAQLLVASGRLIVSGRPGFSGMATVKIRIRLTPAGRRLLEGSTQLQLTARARFTPAGGAPIALTRSLLLKR